MTEGIFPKEILDQLKPEYVTPLVVFLAHENCKTNGNLFECAGGYYGAMKMYNNIGQ